MRFKRLLSLSLLAFSPCLSFGKNLQQIYDLATVRDPALQAAFAQLQANSQAVPQALAAMAPNLSANYVTTGTHNNVSQFGNYNTRSYGLTLNQPIFHPELWAQLEQARHVVKGADAAYLNAAQELIIRVATQYFAILGAIDDLNFTTSQKKAFARELEQTQQRFEVGLIAITDVQDAKARYDTAVANEIAAQNTVYDQYERMREIIGIPVYEVSLFPISAPLDLITPMPNDQESWVCKSHQYNLEVLTAKENAEQQKAQIALQVANHYPKFDLQGNVQRFKQAPPFPFDQLAFSKSLSLNISMPIFSGGGVVFRTQEAAARYQESLMILEARQRNADSATRQAFRGVLTAISEVNALAQTVASNRAALEATRASYEVGTRTIVDVLNSETALLNSEREHSKARYKYLLESLKLKRAAGILNSSDICTVNEILLKRK